MNLHPVTRPPVTGGDNMNKWVAIIVGMLILAAYLGIEVSDSVIFPIMELKP